MVYNCLRAIENLEGKSYGLLSIPSIKPLNTTKLSKILKKYKKIITVEDHSIYGGLGSIISEIIAEKNISVKFKSHGIKEGFIDSDTPSNLEKIYQMNPLGLKKIFQKF